MTVAIPHVSAFFFAALESNPYPATPVPNGCRLGTLMLWGFSESSIDGLSPSAFGARNGSREILLRPRIDREGTPLPAGF
jgi:hypothetical protein